MKRNLVVTCLLVLIVIMASWLRPTPSQAATIAYTSFEEPGTGAQYFDTGDPATDHALPNNAGEAPVNYIGTGGELGFTSYYYNTRGDVGLTEGDYVGVTNYVGTAGAYADGVMRTTLDAVSLVGYSDSEVSIQYFGQETGWEPEDVLHIWVEVDGGAMLDLIDTSGSDIDDLGIEGSWQTVTQSLASYTQATLHFELDSNAAAESVWFDNVLFSGTAAGDQPPQVTTTTPANGATSINTATSPAEGFYLGPPGLLTVFLKCRIIESMKIQNYDIMKKHASLCRAIGHANRLMIMELLQDREKSVGEIAEEIGISISTTSQHLRVLKDNNIVIARREGQTIYYSLKYPEMLQACRLIRKVLLEDMIKSGEAAESVGAQIKP